jgi:sigma-B regulation protein RsbU (phosphoserine phosphatase)
MPPSLTSGFRHTTGSSLGIGVFPSLVVVEGEAQRTLSLKRSPFTVGRKADRDLVFADARVSREHAEIVSQEGKFFVVDVASRHGTFVNGQRVQRHQLHGGDRLEFGIRDSVYVVFQPGQSGVISPAREFLDQLPGMNVSTDVNDMEKLTIFLDAARKLNSAGVLDEILVTLLDTTLKLAQADRAYVFLYEPDRTLRLAAGRNSQGITLLDDATISHSILADALRSNSEFLLTDNSQAMEFAERQSIVAYDLRTIVCLPLRKRQVQRARDENTPANDTSKGDVLGALYLDSRSARRVSAVSHDILRAIATEATSVVESARLVQAEESARRYQQELSIAASIQQGLMAVTIPDVAFAKVAARNLSCSETGGDFYDAVRTEDKLAVVITDVCGKGVSAALLASTLQGMINTHLAAGMPLAATVGALNRFLTQKRVSEKYATMFIARIDSAGDLEYVNCGHVLPLIVSRSGSEPRIVRPEVSNLPVGLLPDVVYECGHCRLAPGDRLLLVTDGVTEAENCEGEFFDNHRLEAVAATSSNMEDIFAAIATFRGATPLGDDCTVVELLYTGPDSSVTR